MSIVLPLSDQYGTGKAHEYGSDCGPNRSPRTTPFDFVPCPIHFAGPAV
jgi:hypothetical protein